MNTYIRRTAILLSSVASSLLLMQGALAQTFSYTSRDLMLTFRQGTSSGSDLEMDIGQASLYYGATPGSVTSLGTITQLGEIFPNLNGLSWFVAGTVPAAGDSGDPSVPVKTLWVTAPRANPSVSAPAWTTASSTAQGGPSGKINSILANAGFYSSTQPTSDSNSVSLVAIPAGNGHEAGAFLGSLGNFNNTFQGDVENPTPTNFSTAGLPSRSDLYELRPNGSQVPGKLLGYFELDADGSVSFTALAAPVVDTAPTNLVEPTNAGSVAVFTVAATGDGVSYQWAQNGTPLTDNFSSIRGSQTASLSLTNLVDASAGTYSVTIVNSAGSTNVSATLTMVDLPIIVTPPANTDGATNLSAGFAVSATGYGLSYQWAFDGTPLTDSATVSGSLTSSLTLSSLVNGNAGTYSVTISNLSGTVSSSATLTVEDLPVIVTQPANFVSQPQGTNVTFSVGATGALITYQWSHNATPIAGATTSSYSTTAQTANLGSYSVVVTNLAGAVSSSALKGILASLVTDTVKPTITVTTPAANIGLYTNSTYTLTGTAKDNTHVASVLYSLNGSPTTNVAAFTGGATLTVAPFSQAITLRPGTNTVTLESVDLAGNTSTPVTHTIVYVQAAFVGVAGSYNGLFYNTNSLAHLSSGFFTAKVTTSTSSAPKYSGKISLNGTTTPFTGVVNGDGSISKTIAGPSSSTITLSLALDATDKQLNGTLSSSAGWTANLVSDKAVFSTANHVSTDVSGTETLLIPGGTNAAAGPTGYGYGAVSISTAGVVTFAGSTADGATMAQSVPVSKDTNWPFYVSLYSGKGEIFGWLNITTNTASGTVAQIDNGGTTLYASGFTNQVAILASKYVKPVGVAILDYPYGLGEISFTNGSPVSPDLEFILIGSTDAVYTDTATKMAFTAATGVFKGTFGTAKTAFSGAVLQQQNIGGGFFLGSAESGSVYLQAGN